MTDEVTLDAVLEEMSRLRAELAQLPTSAFARRVAVQDRLTSLRAAAAHLRAEAVVEQEALRARLERLEAELERRLAARVSHSAAAQTGQGGGIDPEYVHELRRQLDAGLELPELKAVIQRIRTQLVAS